MATIKLTKVDILSTPKYIVYDSGTPTEVTAQAFMVVDLDGKTIFNYREWSQQIAFNTLSKNLLDKQYATQANGYHWVKIAGYEIYKIPPEYITNNTLSQAGIDYIKERSVAE